MCASTPVMAWYSDQSHLIIRKRWGLSRPPLYSLFPRLYSFSLRPDGHVQVDCLIVPRWILSLLHTETDVIYAADIARAARVGLISGAWMENKNAQQILCKKSFQITSLILYCEVELYCNGMWPFSQYFLQATWLPVFVETAALISVVNGVFSVCWVVTGQQRLQSYTTKKWNLPFKVKFNNWNIITRHAWSEKCFQ